MTPWVGGSAASLAGLVFGLTYVLVVFAVQPLLLRRRTGRSAWLSSLGANRARTANILFLAACGLELANPALALARIRPLRVAPAPAAVALSVVLFLSGLVLAVVAQNLLALQIQTRLVKEPHLQRLHSRAYHDYAARVGRFLPLVGRCRRTG
jgi:protein-S-isoprenylcysteine O-methyltransferase Ste14